MNDLKDAEVLSELDFNEAFHQLETNLKTRILTAFATESGTYWYMVLLYGISVAPEIFQQTMIELLQDCEGVGSIWDNVIVHGKNMEKRNKRLEKVFEVLAKHNLTLNKEKCKFGVTKLEFMEHLVSKKGIKMGENKVDDILYASVPTTVIELRGFLGLVNFCGKFIPHMAVLTDPLRKLLEKNVSWN